MELAVSSSLTLSPTSDYDPSSQSFYLSYQTKLKNIYKIKLIKIIINLT